MIYLQIFLGSLLGVMLYALVKVRSINKRMPGQPYWTVLKAYLYEDRVSINTSVVTILAVMFISSEWLDFEVMNLKAYRFVKTFSICFGYMSSSIAAVFLSKTEQKIKEKIE